MSWAGWLFGTGVSCLLWRVPISFKTTNQYLISGPSGLIAVEHDAHRFRLVCLRTAVAVGDEPPRESHEVTHDRPSETGSAVIPITRNNHAGQRTNRHILIAPGVISIR